MKNSIDKILEIFTNTVWFKTFFNFIQLIMVNTKQYLEAFSLGEYPPP